MIAPYVIAGGFAVLSLLGVLGVAQWLWRAVAMSRWPTAKGAVTSSWDMLDGERMKYAYAVGARRYVGHQLGISIGGRSTLDKTPQEIVEKYPPGADVTVYYNPKHPATAVLEPHNMKGVKAASVFAFAWAFFALIVLVFATNAHH